MTQFVDVRCPTCNKKLAEAKPGSMLRCKCPRCKRELNFSITNNGAIRAPQLEAVIDNKAVVNRLQNSLTD